MENYYNRLHVGNHAGKKVLLQHLGIEIRKVQAQYQTDPERMYQEVDHLLDIYNTLSNNQKRKKYDQLLYFQRLAKRDHEASQDYTERDKLYMLTKNPPTFKVQLPHGGNMTGYIYIG